MVEEEDLKEFLTSQMLRAVEAAASLGCPPPTFGQDKSSAICRTEGTGLGQMTEATWIWERARAMDMAEEQTDLRSLAQPGVLNLLLAAKQQVIQSGPGKCCFLQVLVGVAGPVFQGKLRWQ